MSCEDKHNNIANKFCPECGQKLEHFDIDKLNEEYSKMVENHDNCVRDFIKQGFAITSYETQTPLRMLVASKNIKEELYFYCKKLHTKKQTMEDLKIENEKYLKQVFTKYEEGVNVCIWNDCDAIKVSKYLEKNRNIFKSGYTYDKIIADMKIEDATYFSNMKNDFVLLCDRNAIGVVKEFLRKLSDEL